MSQYTCNNPVVEMYKGIPIRKYNKVDIRLDTQTYKDLIDEEEATGLSLRAIVAHSSTPCKCCENTSVTVYNNEDNPVNVRRGILSKRLPIGSGTSKKRHLKK